MALNRADITVVDDDGTQTTGTVFDAAFFEALYDAIDEYAALLGPSESIPYFNMAGPTQERTFTFPDADATVFTSAGIANTALKIYDTNASHFLTIAPGSDLTANRTLTLTTGDAARTVTLSGNPTLADWFDQSVKQAASPTFAALTTNGVITATLTDLTVTIAPAASGYAGIVMNKPSTDTTTDFGMTWKIDGTEKWTTGMDIANSDLALVYDWSINGDVVRLSPGGKIVFGPGIGTPSGFTYHVTVAHDSGSASKDGMTIMNGTQGIRLDLLQSYQSTVFGTASYSGGAVGMRTNQPLIFGTNDLERMRIGNDGKVTIVTGPFIIGATTPEIHGGGSTSSFPMWQRNGAVWHAKLADNSAYTGVDADYYIAETSVRIGSNPAATGGVRLSNNTHIKAHNAANNADKSLAYLDTSNVWQVDADAVGVNFGATVKAATSFSSARATGSSYSNDAQAVANNAVISLGADTGLCYLFVTSDEDDTGAIFILHYDGHVTTEVNDPAGIFSTTAGTGSSFNIYWSSGNSRYELENKRGGSRSIRVMRLGV